MGRRRGRTRRASSRRVSYFRPRRRSGSTGMSLNKKLAFSFGYGLIRGQVSNVVSRLASSLNLNINLSDELLMGFTDWAVAKNSRGTVKTLAEIGAQCEAYSVGRQGLGSLGIGVQPAPQQGSNDPIFG